MSTFRYIIRRILYAIPIILGVCLVIFILFNVVAPDPSFILAGKNATPKRLMEIRDSLGLNRPMLLQFLDLVKSAFTFDFGHSWSSHLEISTMIRNGAFPSLTLTVPAFFISTVMAIVLSLVVSFYRGQWIDKVVVFVCVLLMSISSLAYILFGQWFFASKLGLFEISGYDYVNFLPYIILPGIIWIFLSIGPDVRFFRSVILDEIYQDYVRTARAKGLSEIVILFKHVLKNAMIPVITYVVIRIPFLILGALLLESFFSIPGLGGVTLRAIDSSDFPVIKAITILTSMAYIVFSIIIDVLYTLVDPRMRLR